MPYIRFPLKAVSPVLNKGVGKQSELRVPSIIGQIRFWLRAVLGAQLGSAQSVYEQESLLLGSTQMASSVTIQVRERDVIAEDVRVLPHSSRRRFREEALVAESRFDLRLIFRPGTTLDPTLSNALSLWLLLGGVGKRSRRMFGSLQLGSRPRSRGFAATATNYPDWWKNWDQIEQRPHLFPQLITLTLQQAFADTPYRQNIGSEADFPVLHPAHCRIIVGTTSFDTAEQANIAFFNILRQSQFRNDEYMFGSGAPRRASPVIAQVKLFDGKLYPVVSAFRSPIQGYPKWEVVDQFMDRIAQEFEAQQVWGEEKLSQ